MALGGSLAGMARVVLRADTGNFNREMAGAEQRFRRTTSGMQRDLDHLGRGALSGSGLFHSLGRSIAFASGTFLGGAGFTYAVRTSVTAASNLNEEINKSTVVFAASSRGVLAWSKDSARAFGLSRSEALGAAGAFGTMFRTSGLATGQAASMSEQMVKLAADMASFNNQDPSEMLDRLRSGLAGEAEPLRRFGVLLSEARVQQEAVRLGLVEQGQTLTDQQKVQARYSLILKDTAVQQGDFARTSGGLANQQRILRAAIADTEAVIGKAFVPTVIQATKALNKWLENPQNQDRIRDGAEETANAFGRVARELGNAKDTLDAIYKLDDPPDWWSHWADDMDRRFKRWGAKQAAPFLFGPFAGALAPKVPLDRPGGGEFLPARRPDNRAGPFGPGQSAPIGGLIPGSVSGTAPRLPGPPGTGIPYLDYLLAQAEGTPGRGDDEAALARIVRTLTGRLAGTRNLGARTELVQAINQYGDRIQSLRDQDAQVIADRARKQREAREKAAERERERARKQALQRERREQLYQTRAADAISRQLGVYDRRLARAEATPQNDDDLAILKLEENFLRSKLKNMRLIQATRDRLNAELTAIIRKENTARQRDKIVDQTGRQQQAFVGALSGVLGEFASNVTASGRAPVTVIQNIHREVSPFKALRDARLAAEHSF